MFLLYHRELKKQWQLSCVWAVNMSLMPETSWLSLPQSTEAAVIVETDSLLLFLDFGVRSILGYFGQS